MLDESEKETSTYSEPSTFPPPPTSVKAERRSRLARARGILIRIRWQVWIHGVRSPSDMHGARSITTTPQLTCLGEHPVSRRVGELLETLEERGSLQPHR